MTTDEIAVMDFIGRLLRDVTQDYIGYQLTEDREDALKATVATLLNRLGMHVSNADAIEVINNNGPVRLKLTKLRQVLPTFDGPYMSVLLDRVVHVCGRIGTYEVLACTYDQVQPGERGHPNMIITCLTCLTKLIV